VKNSGYESIITGVKVKAAATDMKTVTAAQTPIDEMRFTGRVVIIRKQIRRVAPETPTILPLVAIMTTVASK